MKKPSPQVSFHQGWVKKGSILIRKQTNICSIPHVWRALCSTFDFKLWEVEQILLQIREEPSSDAPWCWLVDVASCDMVLKGNHEHHLFILLDKTGGRPAPMKTFKILPEISACPTYYDSLLCTQHLVCEVNKDSVSRTTTYSERRKTSTTLVLLLWQLTPHELHACVLRASAWVWVWSSSQMCPIITR